MTSSVAVVLAAGSGSRFEGSTHKLLAEVRGRPLVTWALDSARSAGLSRTVVVTGAIDLSDVVPPDVVVVDNPDWAAGMATSLQAALAHVREAWPEVDAVVVGLGDQPDVTADAWRSVAASPTPIAVATYDGARRNPVRLHRDVWPLLPSDGDAGARLVMGAHPDLVAEVPCTGSARDVDTVADLRN